jgi:hypothetical protein
MLTRKLKTGGKPQFQPLPEIEHDLAEKEKAANQAKRSLSRSAKASSLEKTAAALHAQRELALKRERSSSDDSDSGRLKPARQKLQGEEGPVALSKRWGTVSDAAQKEHSLIMFKVDINKHEQPATSSSEHTGLTNNLRKNEDPVKDAPGKVWTLKRLRENIYKSVDALNLPNGAESRVFHQSNFADQTKVICTATNAYTNFVLELACERGIPAKERECRGKDKQDGVPKSEIQQTPVGRKVINATYVHI